MGVRESGGVEKGRPHIRMCSLDARGEGLPPAAHRRMVEGQSSHS